MLFRSFITGYTGLSVLQLYGLSGTSGLMESMEMLDGSVAITRWNVPNVAAPTAAAIAAALAAPEPAPSLATLAADLVAAASAACDAVYGQVAPDAKHATAYSNAAAVVGPAAVVPTADPAKSAFVLMAASFGFASNPQGFATLVTNVAAASMTLSAILGALEAAAAKAATPADLAAALGTFETALGSLVATLNGAGLTITVTAPAAITVTGLGT